MSTSEPPSFKGYIDRTGKVIIEPRFHFASPFSSRGLAYVITDEGHALIDRQGRYVAGPCPRDSLHHPEIKALEDEDLPCPPPSRVIHDAVGEDIIISTCVSPEGLSCACRGGTQDGAVLFIAVGGEWGFVDQTDRFVIPPRFTVAWDFHDGYAKVVEGGEPDGVHGAMGGMRGYIDEFGDYLLPPQFPKSNSFSEGLALVCVGGSIVLRRYIPSTNQKHRACPELWTQVTYDCPERPWGFIDRTGRMAIPPQFAYADDFHEGLALAAVNKGGPYGYIDKTGKFVIEPVSVWPFEASFSQGLAVFSVRNPKWEERKSTEVPSCDLPEEIEDAEPASPD